MNRKAIGEKGQNCVIGELAKWDIPIGIMLSDNLPFDLVAYHKGKLFRIQVKTSTQGDEDSINFGIYSNNWHKKTTKLYTIEDCDLVIGYDLKRNETYIFEEKDFSGKKEIRIRINPSRNNQTKGVNFSKDYIISEERINKVFK